MRRVVLLALMFAALPSLAQAACPRGAQCGRVTVPLDRAGATPGTLSIAYALVPATGTRTGTIAFLSGGPGQPAIPSVSEFARLLEPLRASYDIVAMDQRGTGDSSAVECEQDCAESLGARRAYLTTSETARDLENLRVALGADTVTPLGISYGAKVAAEYVRRFPDRTAAVVLDSPTPVDGLDGPGRLRVLSAPRVLREVCFPGLCHRTVTDPIQALKAAVARLPLTATAVSRSGRTTRVRVSEDELYMALATSDRDPGMRAGLPAAIASLARGDATPLLHLFAVASGEPAVEINGARFLATTCTEARLPWEPESPVASRRDALRAFIAERADAFAPFSAATALDNSAVPLCETWPPTPRPEPVAIQGPDVPVLVLSGREDLRTPLEDARRTAAQYPNATLLAVPGVGHSVLRTDPSGCALTGLVAFLRGGSVERCARSAERPAAPYAPATIGALRPTRLSGRPGRTLSALSVTLAGIAFDAAAHGRETFRLPGLRAGYVRATRRTLTLHGVEWIRGVRVTGRLDSRGRGIVTVSGRNAAPGTVTYGRGGASGTLGGRAFTL